ncbi:MAG: tetratricopeptide repeat protein [Flammeovirgaceae bacterium]|nr:tetratricopeptide repeat protein [Flammeovirgaceae bacterium]
MLRFSFFALILLIGCSDSREVRLQKFLLKGNIEAEARNFDQASYYFREALELDSCYIDAWNNLGTIYHLQKRYDEAVMQYTKALQCDSNFVLALINRANSNLELKKNELAIRDFEVVIGNHPDSIPILFSLGLAYNNMRQFDQAMKWYFKVLVIDKNNMEAMVNIGVTNYSLKEYDTARSYLMKTITSTEKSNAFNALALIEMEIGEYSLADEWIEKALSEKPKDPFFLNNRDILICFARIWTLRFWI